MGIYQDRKSLSQVQMLESTKFGLKIDILSVLLVDEFLFLRAAKYTYGTV